MKLALALLSLVAVNAANHKTLKGAAARSLMQKARKLNEEDQQDDEDAWLGNYVIKMISCVDGEKFANQDGEYEYASVIYRMCPDDGTCSDESEKGCKKGYGDYVVGLQTFAQQYLNWKGEEMVAYDANGDEVNLNEYAECRQYEQDNDDDAGNDGTVYYVGPACINEGTDIGLALYADQYCSYAPEGITFEDISNGWSLPYSTGGLVSTSCNACGNYNDDGEYEISQFCTDTYEQAGKCETELEITSNYGKQEGQCEYIASIMPSSGSAVGKIFGFFILALVIVGIVGYVYWWKQKKNGVEATSGSTYAMA